MDSLMCSIIHPKVPILEIHVVTEICAKGKTIIFEANIGELAPVMFLTHTRTHTITDCV